MDEDYLVAVLCQKFRVLPSALGGVTFRQVARVLMRDLRSGPRQGGGLVQGDREVFFHVWRQRGLTDPEIERRYSAWTAGVDLSEELLDAECGGAPLWS